MFYNRCRLTSKPIIQNNIKIWPIATEEDYLCNPDDLNSCPIGLTCGNPATYHIPLDRENLTNNELISYGITTFDNLGVGILSIFVNITLEGWTIMMYNLMDVTQAWMAIIFTCSLVILGAFFLL